MRLIDADLLGLTDMEIIMCDDNYKEALKMLIDKIEHAPTIEPKKGKWIVYYECPKCGEITKDFTEYCPFCGADMREGEVE